MPLRTITRWLGPTTKPKRKLPVLWVEPLEGREVPSVTLSSIGDTQFSNNKPLFIPLTNTAATAGTTYTATSDNSSVSLSVLPAGKTWELDVTGTDRTGATFSGTVTIRLFADVAPLAVQRITEQTNAGFFNGKTFFRVIDDFIIQSGSSNNTASGPSSLPLIPDEYSPDYTFNSRGVVGGAEPPPHPQTPPVFNTPNDTPPPPPPPLPNFNHTIFGLVTSGFDTLEKIFQGTASGQTATNPTTITTASIIDDNANGVLRVQATGGFTGTANVTVTGSDAADGTQATTTFAATAVADPADDRPYLGTIPAVAATSGTATTVSLPVVNLDADTASLTYRVGVPGDIFTGPANVTASVNAATRELTVTPAAGFTGSVQLLVGVRDNSDLAQTGDANSAANFDTQVVTVNVTAPGPATVVLGASKTTVGQNRTVLLTANVSGDNTASGSVQFFDGTTSLATVKVLDGRALLSTVFATTGSHTLTAAFTPIGGSAATATSSGLTETVTTGTAPEAITAQAVLPGNLPIVSVKRADGTEAFAAQPFEASFTGGVRVAVADVTNDGQADLVTVAGFGGAPVIKIYNGSDGALLATIPIFEDTFRGGLYVDAKDALGKGYAQILVGAGATGGPRVSLYDFVQSKVVYNYFAYDETLRSGVSVSLSDLRGGLQYDLLTVPGQGAPPAVGVYAARRDDGVQTPVRRGGFFGGSQTATTGQRITAGALGSNGVRPIQILPFDETSSAGSQDYDPITQGIFPAS